MRYIELNLVRAGMVDDPASYRWSSYRTNALNESSAVITPHAAYVQLGTTVDERCASYRTLFCAEPDADDAHALRAHTKQSAAWGSESFQREIEATLGRRVTVRPLGRPPRSPA
jgi:putative transposase